MPLSEFLAEHGVAVGLGAVAFVSVVAYFVFGDSKGSGRSGRPKTLDGAATVSLPLAEKIELSHDTRLFRFSLPTEDHVLGLPTGQHVSLSYRDDDNKLVMRAYTPTSSDAENFGHVDLVIKVYFKDVHPKFPDGGKMSQHLNDMAIGDTIDFAGPKGKLTYNGESEFEIRARPRDENGDVRVAANVGMIAGGTGITPMLQVIRAILRDPNDTTRMWLLFANQTENDILLREELEAIAADHPERFHLWFTIDRSVEDGWEYDTGFVNADMVGAHMPAPDDDTIILSCGPPPMIKFAIQPAFDALGYTEDMTFFF